MLFEQEQLTSSVIMVRPVDFGFNEQTGRDNEFQHKPSQDQSYQIRELANKEFEHCVETLNNVGINVQVLGKSHTQNLLPDAIFPNNWFSTRANGELIIYPMKTPNRRDEVQVAQLHSTLEEANFDITKIIDLRETLAKEDVLEGTGSLIFHHPSSTLFAAISDRCQERPLEKFADLFNYQLVKFSTKSASGMPVYHTNVLMSCGEQFAVITEDVLIPADKKHVIEQLDNTIDDLIIISEQQMSESFCGNILQLKDNQNEPVIVMSNSAYRGFTGRQQKQLEKNGNLAILEIPTIEKVGGGSARCMLAENFLPQGNS